MQEFHINAIGLAGGVFTTVAFLPQLFKILKTKHVRDVSLIMYIILTSGIVMWLIYGLLIKSAPVIFANMVSVVLCSVILVMKIIYSGKGG